MIETSVIINILEKFPLVGNDIEIIFTQDHVGHCIDACCFKTAQGYFVLFQADYLSSNDEDVEKIIFDICKKQLNVSPLIMMRNIVNNGFELCLKGLDDYKPYMEKFAIVSVALKGDGTFYSKWFRFRERYSKVSDNNLVLPEILLSRPKKDQNYKDKIGGKPDELLESDFPHCLDCSKKMTFFGQLDSIGENDAMIIADSGLIAVFVCYSCLTTQSIIVSP